jgi:hypothetical protein
MAESFTFGLIGKEDLNKGYGTFSPTLPDGSTPTMNKVGLHTFQNVYNIEDFGAAVDGSTEDTTEIQNAIDQAETDGGGVVWIPPGKTTVSGQLTMKSTVYIGSMGGTIQLKDDADASSYLFRYATGKSFCGVLGTLILDGNDGNQANGTGATGQIAIQIEGACTDMWFDRIYAHSWSKDAVHTIDNSGTPATPQRIYFNTLLIEGSGRNGLSITAGQDMLFDFVEARNSTGASPEAGVDIETNNDADICKNITFKKLHTHDNNGDGLQILNRVVSSAVEQGYVTIHELDCHDNGGNGSPALNLAKCSHVKILSGAVYDNTGQGISLPRDVRHIKLLNLDVYGNGARGCSFVQTTETITTYDVDFTGCRFYNNSQTTGNTQDGIRIGATAQSIAKVNLRDVYAYDDQAVATQRYGVSIGSNVTEVAWDGGKAWSNATDDSSGLLSLQQSSMVLEHIVHKETDLTFAEVADGASGDATVTINGIATPFEYSILATPDNTLQSGLTYYAFCSNTNEVTVRVTNCSGGPLTPTQLDWMIQLWAKD